MNTKQKPWDTVEHEESGDDQWIVSYADMVTLLFGFFVILYSFSTMDEKKFDQFGENLASAFKANSKDTPNKPSKTELTNEERQLRALQLIISMMNNDGDMGQALAKIEGAAAQKFKDKTTITELDKTLKDLSLGVAQKNEQGESTLEIVIPDHILFGSGDATLSAKAKSHLTRISKDIQAMKGIYAVEVLGHTDHAAPSAKALFKSNFALSSARAGAVADVLIRGGIEEERISVKGMGSLSPVATDKANEAKNRRVQIILHRANSHAAH